MATRIYATSITVQPGTAIAAPISQPWATEDNIVDNIEVLIPPGNNGFAGVRVMKGDVQLVPWGQGTWIVGNDTDHYWPIGEYLPTRDVTIQAYNTGSYPHTYYLRMQVTDAPSTTQQSAATESDVATLATSTVSSDPLSPDQILGTDTVSLLADGTLTASDVVPVDTGNSGAPSTPQPAT